MVGWTVYAFDSIAATDVCRFNSHLFVSLIGFYWVDKHAFRSFVWNSIKKPSVSESKLARQGGLNSWYTCSSLICATAFHEPVFRRATSNCYKALRFSLSYSFKYRLSISEPTEMFTSICVMNGSFWFDHIKAVRQPKLHYYGQTGSNTDELVNKI